jgi:multicomponent Na+:H+ antiporter subunit C
MTPSMLYAICGTVLFGVGFHGAMFCRHLLRKVMALNLTGSGVFLVLIALAARTPSGPPDPVPHAMVLTGIVVAISATALMLALIRRLYRETGLTELPERIEE